MASLYLVLYLCIALTWPSAIAADPPEGGKYDVVVELKDNELVGFRASSTQRYVHAPYRPA
ncbi:hypothetical protein L226DRAFT_238993 [Lentinus tigrinus ALCF2SS1-7]|uniref:Uncharacterized protein n=1 Tax=Lentinus tigrinus ALCF2SS1-6 TaxID=1328759 RepID=A0A5C2SNW6_9APHY|nr:hypothetical protein L227DRAFT_215048 [Lentinus tigrinus ALCF2SS1-6]RPD79054.1 hypothetical protein L226DRAFT_238993 [Lentinus tigrinus ALCF2SS1-7]